MLKLHVSTAFLVFIAVSLLYQPQDTLAAPEIVGAPNCKSCHKAKTGDQWKIWTESAHAGAFEKLASAESKKIATEKGLGDPQTEDACLRCHATRAFLGDDVLVSAKGKYANSEGVGCEACHGPGSDYKPMKVMKDPQAARAAGLVSARTAEACGKCHNEQSPTFKGFDFEARWVEIAHPVPGKAQAVSGEDEADTPDEIAFRSSVGDVLFPHNLHIEELEIDCVDCHHQIHAGELDTPHPEYLESSWIKCKICHDPESKMSKKYYKCADCHHSVLENIADETLSSKVVLHKSCWQCHASGTAVQASESCGDCHVKEND